MFKRLVAVW